MLHFSALNAVSVVLLVTSILTNKEVVYSRLGAGFLTILTTKTKNSCTIFLLGARKPVPYYPCGHQCPTIVKPLFFWYATFLVQFVASLRCSERRNIAAFFFFLQRAALDTSLVMNTPGAHRSSVSG